MSITNQSELLGPTMRMRARVNDNGYVNKGNNSALGKGGILIYPFLDLNQNGRRDIGEKIVLLSKGK